MLAVRSLTPDPRTPPGRWCTIAECAQRTAMTSRAWRARARALADQGLARLAPAPSGKGKRVWLVHQSVDARLTSCPDLAARDGLADLSEFPAEHVERAQQRVALVRRFEELRFSAEMAGRTEVEICRRVVAEAAEAGSPPRVSVRSLQRWRASYRSADREGQASGLRALVPKYTGNAAARVGTADGGPSRSPEAIEFFYSLYHTERRLGVALCHEWTMTQAGIKGWNWPPSVNATRQWLKRYDDRAHTLLCRYGYEKWAHEFMPSIEQDNDSVAPGQLYVGDSHDCKFFIQHRGKAVRPCLIAVQDVGSRMIVGWTLCLESNQDQILLALRRAFLDFGVCASLKIDNGKDYSAQLFHGLTKAAGRRVCRQLRKRFGRNWRSVVGHARDRVFCDRPEWKGLLPELGVRVIFANPYEPQSKMVERWFRTLTERCWRLLPGFCDTSPELRTDGLAERIGDVASLLTLDQARQRLGLYLAEYHQRAHGSLAGLSPQARWASTPKIVRVATESALDLLLQVRGLRKVRANGVEVKFGGAAVRFGQYNPALAKWKGRDVLVACDPRQPDSVICLDPASRRLICRALANRRIAPDATGEDLREASRDKQRAKRVARQARASAGQALRTVEQIASERARRQALAATGTYDRRPADDTTVLSPVRTGFEEASKHASRIAVAQAASPSGPDLGLTDWLEPDDEDRIGATVSPSTEDDGDWDSNFDEFETELEPVDDQGTGLEDWDDDD